MAVHQSSTPCPAVTSRHPHGSPPSATSPRSCRPPRSARRRQRRPRPRRRRGLRIVIVAGDALHVHDAADHDGNVCPVPVTTPTVMVPVNVSVMTIMVRQLDRGADCTSKRLAAPLRDRTAWRTRCAVSHGSPPSATSPHSRRPPRCARRRHSAPHPRRQCGLRPSLAFAPRCAPLPTPSAACSARLPSPPPALTATQSPWRLPSAGFAGVDSPSLIPQVLSYLTACRGFGFHTPRIPDAGCAIRTLSLRLSALPPPSAATLLLDRAYVAPIHAGHPAPGHIGLRLSYTGTRTIHASRCRIHGPVHDRHAPTMVASASEVAFVPRPYDYIRTSDNPKSPHRRQSGSNDRKETTCLMPADQPLPGSFRRP